MSEKGLSSNADLICCGWENKYFSPWNLSNEVCQLPLCCVSDKADHWSETNTKRG